MMRNRLVIASVVLINAALALFGSLRQQPTVDESRFVPAGLEHWRTGTFQDARDVPPLARMISALPLLASRTLESAFTRRPDMASNGRASPAGTAPSDWEYRLARMPGFLWWAIGAWFIHRWARELYGDRAALLALVLWASNPNVLACEQTATPDLPCAVACLAATYAFWRWLQRPSWPKAILTGILLGLAQLTDFAVLGLPVAWLALVIAYGLLKGNTEGWRTLRRRSAQVIAGVLVALFIVNAGYGFTDTCWPLKDFRFVSHRLSGRDIVTDLDDGEGGGNRFRGSWIRNAIVPVPPDFIAGVDLRLWASERRDQDRAGGPSHAIDRGACEPDVLLAKTPTALILLATAALTWMLLRRPSHAALIDDLAVWITPAVIGELALSPLEFAFSMPVMLVLPIPFLVVGVAVLGAAFDRHKTPREGEPPCEPASSLAPGEGEAPSEPASVLDPGESEAPTDPASALARMEGDWGGASPSPQVSAVAFPRRGPRQWLYALPVGALTIWTVASGLVASARPLTYVNEIATLWPALVPAARQPGPGYRTDVISAPRDSVVLPADRPGTLYGGSRRSLRGIATEDDLIALKGWLDKHPEAKPPGLACGGRINPRRLGIEFTAAPHDPGPTLADAAWYTPRTGPSPGYFVLDQWSLALERYRYFKRFQPMTRVGDSIAVYHITLEQAEQARRAMGRKPLGTLAKSPPNSTEHGLLERVFKYPDGRSFNYAVFIPDDYKGDRLYPLILFLHGKGEAAVRAYIHVTFPAAINNQKHTFSFIAVIPQGHWGNWRVDDDDSKAAMDILARVENQYRVDSTRIYLTGVSGGGLAVWNFAATYPNRWAAIVPLATSGDPRLAPRIASIPCWCFHNSFDRTSSASGARRMIEALRAAGGSPRYTEYHELTADFSRGAYMAHHNCWDRAYNMPALYDWMIQQRRSNATIANAGGR